MSSCYIEKERRRIAERFYHAHFPQAAAEIEYINFHYPVETVPLSKGMRLLAWKDPRISPYRTTFFTHPGTPTSILGVHHSSNLLKKFRNEKDDSEKTYWAPKVLAKVAHLFEVLVPIPSALHSVCAPGLDLWSIRSSNPLPGIDVKGGGWQFKIPRASHHVRWIPPREVEAMKSLGK